MMRRILAALLLVPALALGAGNDLLINQRNPGDTATLTRGVVPPAGGGIDGLMGYAGSSNLPVFYRIGAGLGLSSGSLVALPQAWADITGKPTLAPVATSGSYADLSNRPAIPAAQVQSDWNAISAPAAILNKPALFSGAYSALTGVPSTFAPAAHTHAVADVTGLQTALNGKFATPAGTTAQYVRGDGSLATLPVARRIETYSGTTDANGRITVTYGTAYPAVPVVQPPAPAAANQVWTTVASTTTGFTLQLNQRNTVTLLSVEVLLGGNSTGCGHSGSDPGCFAIAAIAAHAVPLAAVIVKISKRSRYPALAASFHRQAAQDMNSFDPSGGLCDPGLA